MQPLTTLTALDIVMIVCLTISAKNALDHSFSNTLYNVATGAGILYFLTR